MKKNFLIAALILAGGSVFAQKKTTTSGTIIFDATTSINNVAKAENKTVIASLDTKAGTVAFESSIKNFAFENPKVQEHFNSPTWLDSDKFATSAFKGKIANATQVNFSKDGTYTADVEGELSMHGVTKPIKTKATFEVAGTTIKGKADFNVNLEDYNIDGPSVGAGKIAKSPKISIAVEFK